MLNVIITNCHQSENVIQILERLRQDANDDVDITVVDDSGDREEFERLERAALAFDVRRRFLLRPATHRPMGVGTARLLGVTQSAFYFKRADWLWFIDGDDMILPGAVQRILEHSRHESAEAFTIPYLSVTDDGCRTVVEIQPSDRLKPWQVGVMAWSKVIRASVFHPFREGVMLEDTDWWWNIAIKLPSIGNLTGAPCYRYRRLSAGSETSRITILMENPKAANPRPIYSFIRSADEKMTRTIHDQFALCAALVKLRETVKRRRPEALDEFDFVLRRNLEAVGS